jgi:hypothetical protein
MFLARATHMRFTAWEDNVTARQMRVGQAYCAEQTAKKWFVCPTVLAADLPEAAALLRREHLVSVTALKLPPEHVEFETCDFNRNVLQYPCVGLHGTKYTLAEPVTA